MDDLLTSYISQMLTTMSKQRSSRGHSRWTSYWREAAELVRVLRGVGQPCSWSRTFAWQLWRMSRSPSISSQGSVYPDDAASSLSSEDDYLWLHLAGHCGSNLLISRLSNTETGPKRQTMMPLKHCEIAVLLCMHVAGYEWPVEATGPWYLYIAILITI